MSGETAPAIGHTVPPEISGKVDEVLDGDVLKYLTETVQRTVIGDKNRAGVQLIILVGCQRGLRNGHGIYPLLNGDPEGGKTWLVRQSLWIFPPEAVEDSGMSPQAIYYDNGNLDGVPRIYYIDDFNGLNEDLKATLKQILTNFRRDTRRKIPNTRMGTTTTMVVPARTILIFTAVDSIGDQQMMSRLYQMPPDDSDDIKEKIYEYTMASGSGEIPDLDAVVDERVEVCREVLRALINPCNPVEVVIPYIREIEWRDSKKSRNYNVLFDLIRLSALVEQRHRQQKNGVIYASYDDFYRAVGIFEPRRRMMTTKLSKGPQRIFDYLRDHPNPNPEYKGYTQAELVEELKNDQGNTSKWLATLQEMTLVVKDRDIRERAREKTVVDEDGHKHTYTDTAPIQVDVYRYVGDPYISTVFDTPIQLSETEKSKPEYTAWKEARI